MKLYLFGGAETDKGQAPILKQLINDALVEIKPQQLLHVPFARTNIPEGEGDVWGEGWVKRDLDLRGIELLDARNTVDLHRAKDYAIFMNGGLQRDLLRKIIVDNSLLYDLVMNANYIIGESAGSMICGQYMRIYQDDRARTVESLGILPSTIIEAHYSQRKRHQQLRDEMKETGAKYGIGIDSITGIVIDTKTYPKDYQVMGEGIVELVTKEDFND